MATAYYVQDMIKHLVGDVLVSPVQYDEQLFCNLFPFLGEPLKAPGIRSQTVSFQIPYNIRAINPEEIRNQIKDKLPGAINELLSQLKTASKENRSTGLRLYFEKETWPLNPPFLFISIAPKAGFECSVSVGDDFITVELTASYSPY